MKTKNMFKSSMWFREHQLWGLPSCLLDGSGGSFAGGG